MIQSKNLKKSLANMSNDKFEFYLAIALTRVTIVWIALKIVVDFIYWL